MIYTIPIWASKIYVKTRDKVSLKNRLYGKRKEHWAIELMKWQQLVNDVDDETVQCMQSQIVAEILGYA